MQPGYCSPFQRGTIVPRLLRFMSFYINVSIQSRDMGSNLTRPFTVMLSFRSSINCRRFSTDFVLGSLPCSSSPSNLRQFEVLWRQCIGPILRMRYISTSCSLMYVQSNDCRESSSRWPAMIAGSGRTYPDGIPFSGRRLWLKWRPAYSSALAQGPIVAGNSGEASSMNLFRFG